MSVLPREPRKAPRFTGVLVVALSLPCAAVDSHGATHEGRPFTIAEEIGIAHFGDPYTDQADALQFSPDGEYFAALTERGNIDLDRPEDSMRIYRTQDVLAALRHSNVPQNPEPMWTISRSTDKDGPIISSWRWLRDSSGIAFIERNAHGRNRLVLADLRTQLLSPLTPDGARITAYDIQNGEHYVYAVADSAVVQRAISDARAPSVVGTGRSLVDLLFPVDQYPAIASFSDRSQLWAVDGGSPFQVKDQGNGQPIPLFTEGQHSLALSPDGQLLLTILPITEIPAAWGELYKPPFAAFPFHLRAGTQDLTTFDGSRLVSQYKVVDLRNGAVRPALEGPTAAQLGWDSGTPPVWSSDGKSLVLPSAFVTSEGRATACVAVVELIGSTSACVERLTGPNETRGYERSTENIEFVRFDRQRGDLLRIGHFHNFGDAHSTTIYRRSRSGAWTVANRSEGVDPLASRDLSVVVNQGLDDSPKLMAADSRTKKSLLLWDPNPQLNNLALGAATVYTWRDRSGRDWRGGLYKAVGYESHRRYPLVIQTHGFAATEFSPSGIYPTAFAARALAGAGVLVLQADFCPILETPEEGPCNVEGFEAAIDQLVKDGIVDAERIGITGFSRTCYHVMEMLTKSRMPIRAASITDGVLVGYGQYMDFDGLTPEYDAIVGAPPVGAGLQEWLRKSPLFNLDKVTAAVQVVGLGRPSLLFMWEPYAVMRYLHKPVDLILLNNDEHILSNPSARLVSQGGSVDWFRFWLQDYEDPDPAKAEQYKRWRELRKLQMAQDAERASAKNAPKVH
jgi:dipeptidyl aminopeptidase/acylaminoacyl peptidase